MAVTVVTASSLRALPQQPRVMNVFRVAPSPTTDSDTDLSTNIMCDDIPLLVNSPELQQHTCLMSIGPPPSRTIPEPLVPAATATPTLVCASSAIAPGFEDAQSLCFGTAIADPVVVAAPPNAQSCECHYWHLGSAEFRACNCDPCSAVQFTGTRAECQNIFIGCVQHDVGGYEDSLDPNAFSVLFLANSVPAIPIPVGQC